MTAYNDQPKRKKSPDIYLYRDSNRNDVTIISGVKWYVRIWYLISNPIRYIFTGETRF